MCNNHHRNLDILWGFVNILSAVFICIMQCVKCVVIMVAKPLKPEVKKKLKLIKKLMFELRSIVYLEFFVCLRFL